MCIHSNNTMVVKCLLRNFKVLGLTYSHNNEFYILIFFATSAIEAIATKLIVATNINCNILFCGKNHRCCKIEVINKNKIHCLSFFATLTKAMLLLLGDYLKYGPIALWSDRHPENIIRCLGIPRADVAVSVSTMFFFFSIVTSQCQSSPSFQQAITRKFPRFGTPSLLNPFHQLTLSNAEAVAMNRVGVTIIPSTPLFPNQCTEAVSGK